jgi:circadian clock protein KaiB
MVNRDSEADFATHAREAAAAPYVLRLYVAGMTSRSLRAVENVRTICKRHLAGRYELQIVDLYQQPSLAREEQVVAAPTLVKRLPLPLRRLVGDMSNERRVLGGLDLTSVKGQTAGSANA